MAEAQRDNSVGAAARIVTSATSARKDGLPWRLIPAALTLALFVCVLTLHLAAAGRVYAAAGGVYIAVALVWLWRVDRR
jgi:drug/metabolite transporter superfamily protein YnfA